MSKPQAKDLSHLLSNESKSRKNSPLKSAFKYYSQPGMTFLGGGLPHSDCFPFDKISGDVPSAPFANGITAAVTDDNRTTIEVYKNKAKNDPKNHDVELSRSLQYGFTEGQPEIKGFLKEHTDLIHKVPYEDWDVICSVGNTESWDSCLRTFANRGDTILVEEHTFPSALEAARAQGITTIPVVMDEEGIVPEAFAKLLDQWVGPKPRFLYTIPTGQNPTGSCISGERRRSIYATAQKHDILIIEDEPYYFLQMEPYTQDKAKRTSQGVHSHEEFVKALVPSYLSMDVDGRVLRLDSVSKTLAPGSRVGWISGQKRFLERLVRYHEVSIQCPSGFATSLLNGLFQRWGQSGYLDWLIGLRAEYTNRRDVAVDSLHEFFPKEVVQILPPVAGMFFTVTLDASKHPKFKEFGEDPVKVETAVYETGLERGTLVIPGSWFNASGETNPPQPHVPKDPKLKNLIFFRGTYAAVPTDELHHGLKKLGAAVKEEFGL